MHRLLPHPVLRTLGTGFTGAAMTAAVLVGAGAPASAACGFSGGDGSSSDPYLISSETDLQCLHDRVNGEAGETTDSFSGASFLLTDDITWTGSAWTTGIGVIVDGLNDKPFAGTFDGGGHEISGLDVIDPTSVNGMGLFGLVSGTIQSVGFSGDVTGHSPVGGLVGALTGVVTDSYATGDVTAGDATGGVSEATAGGLVGYLAGTVTRSYATGAVAGGSADGALHYVMAGGLVGDVEYLSGNAVIDSYALGAVSGGNASNDSTAMVMVGGLIGRLKWGTATRSYSTGAVSSGSSISGGTIQVGGFVGNAGASSVSASFWDTDTSGTATGTGSALDSGAVGRTTAQMTTLSTFTAASWSIAESCSSTAIWGLCATTNSGYPYLTWYSGGATTTVTETYTFTFDTSNGGVCFYDAQVSPGAYVLPDSRVACTPEGTELVGWTIPGQDRPFSDGGTVIASADQTFTAVAKHSTIEVTYDANVGDEVACLVDGSNVEDRTATATVWRDGVLASTPPCTPAGVTFAGWTDRPTLDGPGQAVDGAMTLTGGADVPGPWSQDPDPVNAITLYALWAPAE